MARSATFRDAPILLQALKDTDVAVAVNPDGELLAVTVAPPGAAEPRLADRQSLANARVVVIDRTGAVRLDVPGLMPDWMPPWR